MPGFTVPLMDHWIRLDQFVDPAAEVNLSLKSGRPNLFIRHLVITLVWVGSIVGVFDQTPDLFLNHRCHRALRVIHAFVAGVVNFAVHALIVFESVDEGIGNVGDMYKCSAELGFIKLQLPSL